MLKRAAKALRVTTCCLTCRACPGTHHVIKQGAEAVDLGAAELVRNHMHEQALEARHAGEVSQPLHYGAGGDVRPVLRRVGQPRMLQCLFRRRPLGWIPLQQPASTREA